MEKSAKPIIPPPPVAPAPAQVPTIGPDPKLARRVYSLLDDHFDEEQGRYRDPKKWNDDAIAAVAKVSVGLVRKIRDSAYAELAEPPEIALVRDELPRIRKYVDDEVLRLLTWVEEKTAKLEKMLTDIKR